MRTAEERIEQLHKRAKELEQRRLKQQIDCLGGASGILLAFLTVAMLRLTTSAKILGEGQMTGTSLLGDNTGGYVLAAVIAFFVGVIITTVIYRRRRK